MRVGGGVGFCFFCLAPCRQNLGMMVVVGGEVNVRVGIGFCLLAPCLQVEYGDGARIRGYCACGCWFCVFVRLCLCALCFEFCGSGDSGVESRGERDKDGFHNNLSLD